MLCLVLTIKKSWQEIKKICNTQSNEYHNQIQIEVYFVRLYFRFVVIKVDVVLEYIGSVDRVSCAIWWFQRQSNEYIEVHMLTAHTQTNWHVHNLFQNYRPQSGQCYLKLLNHHYYMKSSSNLEIVKYNFHAKKKRIENHSIGDTVQWE